MGTNSCILAGATSFLKHPPTRQSMPTILAPQISKDKLAKQGNEWQTRGTQKSTVEREKPEDYILEVLMGVLDSFLTKCYVLVDLNKLLKLYFYFIHMVFAPQVCLGEGIGSPGTGVAGSCAIWMLGTEPGSSTRAASDPAF